MPAYSYPVGLGATDPGALDQFDSCACADCRDRRGEPGDWRRCTRCADTFDYSREGSVCPDGLTRCSPCADAWEDEGEDPDYYSDADDDAQSATLHGYSYRPVPNFLSMGYDDPDYDRLHLGVELEVPADNECKFADAIFAGPGNREDVLYCKEDGSIQGVEIVSHPMTHAYFRSRFPFSMFADEALTGMLFDPVPGEGYGLHVHVSRSGFKSQSHTLRWLLLMYRHAEHVERIARRHDSQWAGFGDAQRLESKASGSTRGERYVAVNACNEATFEVRVFRSTWKEQEFRAAVDLVHASVTYTRDLSPIAAVEGGLDWSTFRDWLDERAETYSGLVAELKRLEPRRARRTRAAAAPVRRPRSVDAFADAL